MREIPDRLVSDLAALAVERRNSVALYSVPL